jgi:hypothetical protein
MISNTIGQRYPSWARATMVTSTVAVTSQLTRNNSSRLV